MMISIGVMIMVRTDRAGRAGAGGVGKSLQGRSPVNHCSSHLEILILRLRISGRALALGDWVGALRALLGALVGMG
jgi:hypothetical protein